MDKPTKYYSSLQEKRIADYLGWKTVAASGARPFNPGDVSSSEWLAECKTHTKPTDKLTIMKSVWKKLCNEAQSKFRKPVLCIDNGTQTIKNTWVVIPKQFCTVEVEPIDVQFHETDKQISLSHKEMTKALSKNNQIVLLSIYGKDIYIMSMLLFHEMLGC